jgi:hypothetical protein
MCYSEWRRAHLHCKKKDRGSLVCARLLFRCMHFEKGKIDKNCMHSNPKRGSVWLHACFVDQVKGRTAVGSRCQTRGGK